MATISVGVKLSVTLQNDLTMGFQTANVISHGAQSMSGLRTLESNGLSDSAIYCNCSAIFFFRLACALPAWFGFDSEAELRRT